MTTKQKLIDDVILQLTQGSPSDDLQLEYNQVAQWATYHLNDLVAREVTGLLQKGYMIPPIYLKREEAAIQLVPVDPDQGDSLIVTGNQPLVGVNIEEDAVKNRFYIDILGDILNLPKDRGLVQLLFDGVGLIYKISQENLMMLNDLRFARPRRKNMTYYRYGNRRIYLDGFGESHLGKKVIVDYIPFQDVFTMDGEDEIKISDTLEPVLVDMLVQRGKLELYGTQVDTANDGTDNKQVQYHTAISNPGKSQAQSEQQAE
jgi:hypothetical protein